MKKYFSAIFVGFLVAASTGHAAVTLGFSNSGFATPIWASGFANAAGTPTDGMTWGIVVDTGKNGFAGMGATAYSAYATPTTAGYLSVGGVLTDDYFIPSSAFAGSDPSYNITQNSTGDGGNGAHGTILDTSGGGPPQTGISVTGGDGASAPGDPFALIWLATNTTSAGSNYGMLTFSTGAAPFVLPGDGQSEDYSANFTGTGPFAASQAFTASGVPEPTSSMLAMVGLAGLFLRRRRA